MAASTLFLAGCCTAHREHMTQWEYEKVYSLKDVNKAAADGWVVVGYSQYINTQDSITPHQLIETYLLKRHKQ